MSAVISQAIEAQSLSQARPQEFLHSLYWGAIQELTLQRGKRALNEFL